MPALLQFKARLHRPVKAAEHEFRAFVVLPREVSEQLPRRGRTTVKGTINGHRFAATLEPDGQLSHWLRVSHALCDSAGVRAGDAVTLEVVPFEQEPEPEVPSDFREAMAASRAARETWQATTTIARLDWIHWIDSSKQVKTRAKRIRDGCDMLAAGKRRVCCFDPSGFYSKALRAPEAADPENG